MSSQVRTSRLISSLQGTCDEQKENSRREFHSKAWICPKHSDMGRFCGGFPSTMKFNTDHRFECSKQLCCYGELSEWEFAFGFPLTRPPKYPPNNSARSYKPAESGRPFTFVGLARPPWIACRCVQQVHVRTGLFEHNPENQLPPSEVALNSSIMEARIGFRLL